MSGVFQIVISTFSSYLRYILVDWLVEVAGMKDFSTQTLHVAIDVVDRYLKLHKTSRSKLQLLGVAAMVICSRYVFLKFFTAFIGIC